MSWLDPYRWLLGLMLVASLLVGAWYLERKIEQRGYDRAESIYTKKIAEQKAEATKLLGDEKDKVAGLEKAMLQSSLLQEIKDANSAKTIAGLRGQLAGLADADGRLRDPNAQEPRCRGSGGSPQTQSASDPRSGPSHPAEATGLLSAELSGLLQRLTSEADELSNAYSSCRADTIQVREFLAQ